MIGENFLLIRMALGMEQPEFADAIGAKSKSVVSNIERNVSKPSPLVYSRVQRRFGFTEKDLTTRKLSIDEIDEAVEKYKKPQPVPDMTLDELKDRVEQLETSYKHLLIEVASIPGKRLTRPNSDILDRLQEKVEIDLADFGEKKSDN